MPMPERLLNNELEKIRKEAVVDLSMYHTGNNPFSSSIFACLCYDTRCASGFVKRMSERLPNNELEKIWKEAVVGLSMYHTGITGGVEEDHERHPSEYPEFPAENRSRNLRKMTKSVAAEPNWKMLHFFKFSPTFLTQILIYALSHLQLLRKYVKARYRHYIPLYNYVNYTKCYNLIKTNRFC
jgi:hypothetical protein